jgi:peptidyl-prolyl cis-trans isomerase-like 3
VIDGFDALVIMEREPVDASDKPLNEIIIYKVSIHANPIAENEQM